MIETMRRLVERLPVLFGERPPSWDADLARRMDAAREVESGVASQVHVAARLTRSRQSHALIEGIPEYEPDDG